MTVHQPRTNPFLWRWTYHRPSRYRLSSHASQGGFSRFCIVYSLCHANILLGLELEEGVLQMARERPHQSVYSRIKTKRH
jgi:hypothetical protein